MAKYVLALFGAVLLFVGSPVEPGAPLAPDTLEADYPELYAGWLVDDLTGAEPNEVIQLYCVRCHSDRRLSGNLTLESFDADAAVDQPEVSEKVIRKLAAGMMPPPGSRRPDDASLLDLRTHLETQLDQAAAHSPNPGRRSFQRLNRAEYRAAIRGMFGMDVDVDAFLPPETMSNNFDNIADAQQLSATLLEGYLRAASHVAYTAMGDPEATPASVTYKIPRTASQLERAEGAPFGTRGGVSERHVFPADGEYVFQMELHPSPTGFLFGRTRLGERVEVSIDGVPVQTFEIDRWMTESDPAGMRLETDPTRVTAGPHQVTAAFIKTSEGPVDDLLTPVDHTLADTQIGEAYGVTTLPHLRDLTIVGPYRVQGVSDNPVRQRILTCQPESPAEARPCSERILQPLATQAYRRILTGDDMRDLLVFYDQGAVDGGFDHGIRVALQALLASPHFIFRLEEAPADAAPGEAYRISDEDLASRLAFFLWSAPPEGRGHGDPIRIAVAPPAGPGEAPPRRAAVPVLRRHPGGCDEARDGALLPSPGQRRPQSPRGSLGRLHVRERAARRSLRDPGCDGRLLPPGQLCGRAPAGHPWTRRRAGHDLPRESHLPGAPGEVGDGGVAWEPAAAATTRCS
jgi:hypothetical protein